MPLGACEEEGTGVFAEVGRADTVAEEDGVTEAVELGEKLGVGVKDVVTAAVAEEVGEKVDVADEDEDEVAV